MRGNNDSGVYPRYRFPTLTQHDTACRIIAFHNVLPEAKIKVPVVGPMLRSAFVEKTSDCRNKRLSEAVVAYQHLILMQDPAMSSFISLIVTIQLT